MDERLEAILVSVESWIGKKEITKALKAGLNTLVELGFFSKEEIKDVIKRYPELKDIQKLDKRIQHTLIDELFSTLEERWDAF